MGLFGALVKTVVNVATLPVAMAADVVTMGGDALEYENGKTHTRKHLEQIKRDADED